MTAVDVARLLGTSWLPQPGNKVLCWQLPCAALMGAGWRMWDGVAGGQQCRNCWLTQLVDQHWWRGWQVAAQHHGDFGPGTVETDPFPPVPCPPGQQRDFGVESMLKLTLGDCKTPFLMWHVINSHFMLLSCACPFCGVSLCLVKDAHTNWPEREAVTHFEPGPVHVYLPRTRFPVVVVQVTPPVWWSTLLYPEIRLLIHRLLASLHEPGGFTDYREDPSSLWSHGLQPLLIHHTP